jgi:hypothetical protein
VTVFADWLADPDATRAILAEVKVYTSGAEVTRYLSTHGFTTEPSDTPSNQWYDSRLAGTPEFTASMDELFTGRSTSAWGELEVDNSDGELDSWLDDSWDGREVVIKIGDPDWSYSQYGVILTGTIESLEISDDSTLRLVIRDRQKELDIPVQESLFTTGDSVDQPIPLCYGACSNVPAILIDPANNLYQVHDGIIEGIDAVYDNGAKLELSTVNCNKNYTEDLANGQFTLCDPAVGTVTVDVKGAKPSGSYLTTIEDIVGDLIERIGPLTTSDIDASSLSALPSYGIGLYIRERMNLLDILDQIANTIGAWYSFNRDGEFTMSVFTAPSGLAITEIDGVESVGDLEIDIGKPPIWRQRVNYDRNHWVQYGDGLASCVAEETCANGSHGIDWLANQWRTVSSSDSAIKTTHLLARDPDAKETILSTEADAQTESDRLLLLHKVKRVRYNVTAQAIGYQVSLGDVITLKDSRFGLSSGIDCRVVGITEHWLDNKVELELWR